jgi:hypothetical protein
MDDIAVNVIFFTSLKVMSYCAIILRHGAIRNDLVDSVEDMILIDLSGPRKPNRKVALTLK